MNYTDEQLKQALVKMLPNRVMWIENIESLVWIPAYEDSMQRVIHDTELLHLCWLAEETLNIQGGGKSRYQHDLSYTVKRGEHHFYYLSHATWQQRVIALAKVKNINI